MILLTSIEGIDTLKRTKYLNKAAYRRREISQIDVVGDERMSLDRFGAACDDVLVDATRACRVALGSRSAGSLSTDRSAIGSAT